MAGALSRGQFGSLSDGTYDLAAHQEWHDRAFAHVWPQQKAQMAAQVKGYLDQATAARLAGDPATARRHAQSANIANATFRSITMKKNAELRRKGMPT